MSDYYKIPRHPNWNFGGPNWKLSRSKIDLFLQCPRCFYLDNKLGVKRPASFPFNLNSAVDALLKKEFDIHRKEGTPHPLMENYGIDAIPFAHEKLDEWRHNFTGVQYRSPDLNFTVSGAVDDLWINPKGEIVVVDYKATSKEGEVSLDAAWQIGYKRQMEVYQWLLIKNGFEVSKTGYFVYCNADADKESFDGKLEFDIKIIPYEGDPSWIDETLANIHRALGSDVIPEASTDCDYCRYREVADEVLKKSL
jgi:CRISPR/Cas system-associated exonuclease Cas4 (RecB family)